MSEWEKVKSLKGKKRLEYLWTYYKFVLLIILIAVLILYIAMNSYHHLTQKQLLSAVIVDMDRSCQNNADSLQKELLELLGSGDEKEIVKVDTSVSSQEDAETTMKLTISLSENGGNDVVICNSDVYEEFLAEGAFWDWKDILGDDYDRYRPYIKGAAIDLSKSKKWKERSYVLYEPAYLCILNKTEQLENIKKFLDFLYKDEMDPKDINIR